MDRHGQAWTGPPAWPAGGLWAQAGCNMLSGAYYGYMNVYTVCMDRPARLAAWLPVSTGRLQYAA